MALGQLAITQDWFAKTKIGKVLAKQMEKKDELDWFNADKDEILRTLVGNFDKIVVPPKPERLNVMWGEIPEIGIHTDFTAHLIEKKSPFDDKYSRVADYNEYFSDHPLVSCSRWGSGEVCTFSWACCSAGIVCHVSHQRGQMRRCHSHLQTRRGLPVLAPNPMGGHGAGELQEVS